MNHTADDVRRLVHDYAQRVWNDHDTSAVAEYAPEVTEFGGDETVTHATRAELVERVADVLTRIPDHRLTVGQVIVQGEQVVWEWRLTGTFHDDRGSFPVDAKGFTYWRVRDGRIVFRDGVMDLMAWVWQIKVTTRRIRLLMPV
ncbi:ester cyclase [Streptomyces chryseus]